MRGNTGRGSWCTEVQYEGGASKSHGSEKNDWVSLNLELKKRVPLGY